MDRTIIIISINKQIAYLGETWNAILLVGHEQYDSPLFFWLSFLVQLVIAFWKTTPSSMIEEEKQRVVREAHRKVQKPSHSPTPAFRTDIPNNLWLCNQKETIIDLPCQRTFCPIPYQLSCSCIYYK